MNKKHNVIASMAKQSLACIAVASLAFGLSACGDDSSSSSASGPLVGDAELAGVIFDGGDYQVPEGELRWIDVEGNISEKSLSFYQDSRVATNGNDVFVMEGLGTDNISLVKPEFIEEGAKKAVAWQVKFENSNPVDMAFDGEEAWVALQNADSLVKISTKDGKVVKSIKRIHQLTEPVFIQTQGHGVDSEVPAVLIVLKCAVFNDGFARFPLVAFFPRTHKFQLNFLHAFNEQLSVVNLHLRSAVVGIDRHVWTAFAELLDVVSHVLSHLHTASHHHAVNIVARTLKEDVANKAADDIAFKSQLIGCLADEME